MVAVIISFHIVSLPLFSRDTMVIAVGAKERQPDARVHADAAGEERAQVIVGTGNIGLFTFRSAAAVGWFGPVAAPQGTGLTSRWQIDAYVMVPTPPAGERPRGLEPIGYPLPRISP